MTDLNIAGQGVSGIGTTSGTYTFWTSRDDIIREAMLNLALLEQDEVPTAAEVADCSRKLNLFIKQLSGNMDKAPGFKMWQRTRGDLFLASNQYMYSLGASGDNYAASVTGLAFPSQYQQNQLRVNCAAGATVLPLASLSTRAININDKIGILIGADYFWTTIAGFVPNVSVTIPAPGLPAAALASTYLINYTTKAQRPTEILTAVLRDINNTDTDLTRMTLEVYEALPTKTQPGFVSDPTAFYYEPRTTNNLGHLYIDCAGAQDVTKHLHIVGIRQVQDYNNPGDATDFPQEWHNALAWHLALMICPMFDGDWTPDRQTAYQLAVTPARESNPQVSQAYFQPEDENNY